MKVWSLHMVPNDDSFMLHGVRVAWAETDKVLCSEVVHFPDFKTLLLPRHGHELESDQLTFTWKTNIIYWRAYLTLQWRSFKSSQQLLETPKRFTFDGDVFHLAVVTDDCENLTALVSSGGEENHLQTHTYIWCCTNLKHTQSCKEGKLVS